VAPPQKSPSKRDKIPKALTSKKVSTTQIKKLKGLKNGKKL